jgi:hypothetical protein
LAGTQAIAAQDIAAGTKPGMRWIAKQAERMRNATSEAALAHNCALSTTRSALCRQHSAADRSLRSPVEASLTTGGNELSLSHRIADNLKREAAELLWSLPRSRLSDQLTANRVQQVLTDGCCIVENFLDRATADKLADVANEIYSTHPEHISLESNGSDKRIYGADRLRNELKLEGQMRAIDAMSRAFYWSSHVAWFQMLGKISHSSANLGSGSGWHRDSPFSHQFKAILYLTDVDMNNGPFEFIKGSHLKKNLRAATEFLGLKGSQYRFSTEQIGRLENAGIVPRCSSLTGGKGSLLLVDSRGLHRGKPLNSGERIALTRYYFPRKIPAEFTRLYPLTGRP